MTNFFDDVPEYDYDDLELDRPGVSLSLDQQVELANVVAERRRSCDGTLGASQEWAQGAGVHWPRLQRELEENGAFCDCEVVLNVFGGGDAEPG